MCPLLFWAEKVGSRTNGLIRSNNINAKTSWVQLTYLAGRRSERDESTTQVCKYWRCHTSGKFLLLLPSPSRQRQQRQREAQLRSTLDCSASRTENWHPVRRARVCRLGTAMSCSVTARRCRWFSSPDAQKYGCASLSPRGGA